jgi:hypothetical protein
MTVITITITTMITTDPLWIAIGLAVPSVTPEGFSDGVVPLSVIPTTGSVSGSKGKNQFPSELFRHIRVGGLFPLPGNDVHGINLGEAKSDNGFQPRKGVFN